MSSAQLTRLQRIFREVLDEPALRLTEDYSTADHPEWDSVAMVQIVLAVEQEFGVELEMAEVAEIKSVADILRLL
ncbi:acyl carrier protein [Ruficoccus sp. ZRK36]|uniref:acyl carrier protein n=1 Tax=Ruficoccus sp. ZRK36 TaxID=2866311 RepID=UPI001C73A93F|nr:acyl carrier protein [Ruficoccus sp. ZRK36]QYY36184.1 acyl carrier protein [Ruficoccus sp. ZRK36]